MYEGLQCKTRAEKTQGKMHERLQCKTRHKKLQGKIHKRLQCKSHTSKNLVRNTLIGFSGKNVPKKISGKCMKSTNIRNFHFQCKKRSGIRSLPEAHIMCSHQCGAKKEISILPGKLCAFTSDFQSLIKVLKWKCFAQGSRIVLALFFCNYETN